MNPFDTQSGIDRPLPLAENGFLTDAQCGLLKTPDSFFCRSFAITRSASNRARSAVLESGCSTSGDLLHVRRITSAYQNLTSRRMTCLDAYALATGLRLLQHCHDLTVGESRSLHCRTPLFHCEKTLPPKTVLSRGGYPVVPETKKAEDFAVNEMNKSFALRSNVLTFTLAKRILRRLRRLR